jgi:hypothetical protein
MSSAQTAGQFRSWVGQPSNIDQCARCQQPRSVHGPDWTCPSMAPHRTVASVMMIAGGVLAVAGILLRVAVGAAGQQQVTLMADGFLLGFVLLATGFALLGRPR